MSPACVAGLPDPGTVAGALRTASKRNRVMMCRCLLVASLLLLPAIGADSAELPLIPMPQRIESMSGSFDVSRETKLLVGDPRAAAAARYFGDLLFQARGFRPEIGQSTASQPPKRAMLFTLDPDAA